ncbi:SUMF1/EgtB/PvdO family nonheme iron enzyme, partial [Thiocapsa marina]
ADPAAGVPVAVTRGGDAGSAPEALELQSARVWPLGALSAEARTGVRWMLGVPVFTSVEKVRAGGSADTEGSVGGDGEPAPIAFTGRLRVAVDRAAAVWVDGVRVGEATPQVPFEGEGIAAGERRIGVRGAGYTAEEQVVVVSVHRPGAIHFKLRPQTPAEREAELGLDGAARAEIRAELTLVGHAAGAGGDAFAASERAALRAFQSAARLEATGYVDEATLNRLAEVAEAARRAREVAEREARVPGGAPAMVSIAAGCFRMGSPSDEPHRDSDEAPHEVCVEAFELGRTEVSFGQYDAFCAATGRDKPSDAGWGRGERPVINVSWDDAAAYAQWLSKETGLAYRLPTEAEWEYAARAGTRTPFWTGRCIRTDQANYNGTSDYNDCGAKTGLYRKQTVPAGSLPGNPWGLHEVLGNVREWTCSEYASPYAGLEQRCAERNSNPARAVRGGSWISGPRFLRAADRFGFLPEDRDIYRGFRLARTLSP